MSKISIEKIKKELDKGTVDEVIAAFREVKNIVAEKVELAQREADEKANQLQQQLENIQK